MNIVLIGMPGCGKSTLGKSLARRIQYTFCDLDHEIVAVEEKSIDDIFSSNGEAYFRQVEKEVLHKTLSRDNQVISTGGGAPCYFDNMEFIKKNSLSIYLNVPIETLLLRLKASDPNARPMLKGKALDELESFLSLKLSEREKYYLQAGLVIEGGNIGVEEMLRLIS